MVIFLLILISFLSQASTHLVLIGGGKRPPQAMAEFVSMAGKSQARLLIIPWASGSVESAENIKLELMEYHPAQVDIAPLELIGTEAVTLFHQKLSLYQGIFFTGGNQNVLMERLHKYQLVEKFRAFFQQGIAFAGTSAGTAIMSHRMLTGVSDLTVINGKSTELAPGLGLLPSNILVDQHFIVRSRFNRLAGVVLDQEHALGLGIDENTSLVIRDNKAKVVGPTQVMLFEKQGKNKIAIILKVPGEEFDLK